MLPMYENGEFFNSFSSPDPNNMKMNAHRDKGGLTVYFVRHGQPALRGLNCPEEIRKSFITTGLSPVGRAQARQVGQFFKKQGFQGSVFASPLERAAETANIICGELGTTYYLEASLREASNPIRETEKALKAKFERIDSASRLNITPEIVSGIKEPTQADIGNLGINFLKNLLKARDRSDVILVTHGCRTYCTVQESLKAVLGKKNNLRDIHGPWNCGCVKLHVAEDGTITLLRPNMPEMLPPELVTDNISFYLANPYHHNMRIYGEQRKETLPVIDVNSEFRKLLAGEISSWTQESRYAPACFMMKNGRLYFDPAKPDRMIQSVIFPVKPETAVKVKVRASGEGGVLTIGFKAFLKTFWYDENSLIHGELHGESKSAEYKLSRKTETKLFEAKTGPRTRFINLYLLAEGNAGISVSGLEFSSNNE